MSSPLSEAWRIKFLSSAGPASKDAHWSALNRVGKPRRDSQLDSERLIVAIRGKFGQGVPAIIHNAVRKHIPGTMRALRDMWIFCSVPFLSKLAYAVAPILS